MKILRRDAGLWTAAVVLTFCLGGVGAAQDTTHEDIDWPMEFGTERYVVVMYEPQLESFASDRIESRAAVSIKEKGDSAPTFGAVWMEARVATDFETRLVSLVELNVTAAKFPDIDDAKVERLSRYLETEIPTWDLTFSLDKLLAGMEVLESRGGYEENFNDAAPEIIYVDHPAVLVVIDGEPRIADLEGFNLKYVGNSPFFIVQDPTSKTYFLKGGEHWYEASSLTGAWTPAGKLPDEVAKAAKAAEEQEKKQAAELGDDPDQKPTEPDRGARETPDIIVRTAPAELIQTDGEPQMAPIEGTDLLYVENTEDDIVMDISSQQYYVLLSGRWFASSSLDGASWTFVANDALPPGFEQIPTSSDMGQVRASVAGTQEAREAVLESSIPQTAEIDRSEAKVTVSYDGDPKFEKCTDDVAYALNTDKQVLLIDGTYYCCDNAVWFVGRGPEGPWTVATEVPEQVQDIPADCPAYTGAYYYHGCVVWGTGWWYRPWWGHYYYPRPVTYGFGFHWNPYTGWGCSFGISYGWLHVSVGRPWYGGWWGPAGYRYGYRHGYHSGYRHGYHHGARAGYRAGYRAGQAGAHSNVYKNRSTGVKRTGVRPTQTPQARPTQARQPRTASPSAQVKKQPRKSNAPNNVYADKNGNLHRKQGNEWQQRQGNSWKSENKKQSPQT
ncbi:MAG: hypothetical protein P8181_13620, partial [bacterium]